MSTDDAQRFEAAARGATQTTGSEVALTGHYRYNPLLAAARYRLVANGLSIIVMPDERAPIFAYQTWFKVGSKHEDPARTGLAHLFEHLMFKGTRNHKAGELDREMERRGAQTNAATWVDWTYYTEALAARDDNLATVVHFESDRMQNLALDEATFRSELDVVKNERRMTVDNSVMGRVSETLFGTAFTAHSYRWPTIGKLEHLETMTLEHAQQFYRTYYAPNNATIVVAGAVDVEEVLTLIASNYGAIPASVLPARQRPLEPPQEAPREVRLALPSVATHVVAAFHVPSQNHPTHAALEMVGEALLVGDNARLYRRLVTEEEFATDVDGFLSPFAEPGVYELIVTLRTGVDPQRALDVLQEELDAIAARGLSEREWRKAHNGLELGALDALKDAEGLAEALGHYETNFGDFSLAFRAMERWAKLTPKDLVAAAREVFLRRNRTTVIAVPEGER